MFAVILLGMVRLPKQALWRTIAVCFLGGCALIHAPAVRAQYAVAVQPKLRLHQSGKVRVFYYTQGQHAVYPADWNRNGVPDQVEDLLTQTLAAEMLFVEVLGFPDPFRTERYQSAAFLDIHMRHKDVLKRKGVAYDELQTFRRQKDAEGTKSLCFNVATAVRPAVEFTPTHEFFHLVQNGITYFKNPWYTEGTARWSEWALGKGALGPVKFSGAWPPSVEKEAKLFSMKYEASEQFWYPLLTRIEAGSGALPDSPALKKLAAMTYVDGTRVLKDQQLKGWKFIRDVLMALGEADDVAFRELGYDGWSEENQRSPKNDTYILRTVLAVARRYGAP